MNKRKIAITLNRQTVEDLDRYMKQHVFTNRSKTIQAEVREKIERLQRKRLSRECARLEPSSEKNLAEEGISGELEKWPDY